MYVVLLHYTATHQETSFLLPDHAEWIHKRYESGDFIAAGQRLPGERGYLLIARAMSRGRLDAILATDPFALRNMVRNEVLEFQALRTIPELSHYADLLSSGDGTTTEQTN